ncbi:S9 family peptidase [Pedobacter immunditicola]|uniref:S9 family peptidase n=1 Tax=Pedobacter immunditicola TaxID=3133440 RepID=UPI0030968EBA
MTGIQRYLWVVLIPLFFACKEQKKEIPVADFFKAQDKSNFALSPDGKSLSYFKLENNRQHIVVESIATGKALQITKFKDKNVNYHFWVSNNELVYYTKHPETKNISLFIITKDGKQETQLKKDEKSRIRVLKDQLIDDKYLLVSSNRRDSTVSDVYRLNVRDGKMEMAVKNPGNITNWYTDADAKLRLATSSDGVNETLLYRASENEPFKPVITNNFTTTLIPIAFAENKKNIIYAISNVNRDKNALVELDCNTGKEKSVLFSNDTLNVVEAQYSHSTKRFAFVVCETWKKEKFYLDDSVKNFYNRIEKLLPNTESRIMDRDKAENVFLLRTYTDKNPGSYYLYTANNNSILKLSDVNPSIQPEDMNDMKPITYTSRDGLTIHGYLTLPKDKTARHLPLVVISHNGPGNRSNWNYNAEVQFLVNRGYAVFQANYRGSSGYGKAFAAAGFKQWGNKINNDIEDGVRWLVSQEIVDSKKVAIYGAGFGGYIALSSLYANPGTYACAISNSGVINLFSYLKAIPPFLKSNLQMFYDMIGNPVTDVDYMRQASPVFHADKINNPVFISQFARDKWINPGEVVQFVKELKKRNENVTYLEKPYADNAQNIVEDRQKYYLALEQFLEVHLKKK